MHQRRVRVRGARGLLRPGPLLVVLAAVMVVAGCVPPPSSPRVSGVDLAVGGRHTCAIQDGGEVYCWGANDRGQLGDGTTSDGPTTSPVRVAGIRGAVALALGVDSSCAVLRDRTVRCWGANDHGQLGDGSTAESPVPVAVVGVGDVVALGGGSGLGQAPFCVVDGGGSVWCWGSGDLTAAWTSGLGDARLVDASEDTICVVRTSGHVACSDDGGPVRVLAGISDAVEIDVSDLHHCAILAAGGVRCWGSNANSQLAQTPSVPYADEPVAPNTNTNVDDAISVAVGSPTSATGYTCAISNELPYCWGIYGWFTGHLPTTGFPTHWPWNPTRMSGAAPPLATVAAHTSHNCARAVDGSIWCWGVNNAGQLGIGHTGSRHRLSQVVGLS